MNGYLTHQANEARLEELRRRADEHRRAEQMPAENPVRHMARRNRWPLVRSIAARPQRAR